MKVSWKWLNEIINISDISLDRIIKKLILTGFEIENIQNKPEIQDTVFDISITANRSDASSLIGISREINTLFNLKTLIYIDNHYIHYKNTSEENIIEKNYNNQLNTNAILNCQLSTITNLTTHISPSWLINYLKAYDIKSEYLIQDIQEYIKIKWGQKIEIFDLNKLNKIDTLNLQRSCVNTELLKEKKTWMSINDNESINSIQSIELLKYNNNILSMIGIQSNPELQFDINTSSIIIACTICKEKYIYKTIKKFNQTKEEVQRYLKYVSSNESIQAYNETIKLILHLTKGTIKELHSIHENESPNTNNIIYINRQHIINILGPVKDNCKMISTGKIFSILQQLNFKPKYINKNFQITIPYYRQKDIKEPTDVIEEIGRVYGFENFFDQLPAYNNKGKISESSLYINKIRYTLNNLGLHELNNYSLTTKTQKHNSNIELYNALIYDQSQLKDTLIKDLILAKQYNIQKKNIYFEFFEISRVFKKEKENKNSIKYNYKESINIAGILGNTNFYKESWQKKPVNMSWFHAKGLLEDFLEQINIKVNWTQPQDKNQDIIKDYYQFIYHPYRLSILCNQYTQEPVGVFGELNTKYNTNINSKHRTYIFEFNLNKLIEAKKKIQHLSYIYTPYSNYPSITRDISISIHKSNTAHSIQQNILNLKHPLVKSVEILNEYRTCNSNFYRKINLRIKYQSECKTLNEIEIDDINDKITQLLKNKGNNRVI